MQCAPETTLDEPVPVGRDASLGRVTQAALGGATAETVALAAIAALRIARPEGQAVVAEVRGGRLVLLAASLDDAAAALDADAPAAVACLRSEPFVSEELPPGLRALGHARAVATAVASSTGPVAAIALHLPEGVAPDEDDVRFVHALATLVALTVQRQRSDEELRASEARYRALVEQAPICIHEIDGDARITAANEMATRLLADGADPVGSSYLAAVADEDRPAVAMRLSQALESRSESFEFRAAAGGRIFEARFIPLPGRDGTVSRLIGVTQDVTEQRGSLEALETSERRFRHLFDSRRDLIALVDLDARFVAANPALERALGVGPGELEGRSVAELAPALSSEVARAAVDAMIASGAEATTYESERVGPDGTRYPLEVTAQLVHEGDRPVVLAVGRDVSERTELEAQLRQAQKLEAIGRLTGGIAHDFNNLLTAIEGYADLALRKGGDTTHYVEGILTASRRAAKLTDQLLTFSRRRPIDTRPLDLNEVVVQVEDMLARLLGEDVDLRVAAKAAPAVILGDAGQLEQVLVNLAVNARDAMPEGGTLTIETHSLELDGLYASRRVGIEPGAYVVLAVSDTGVGMDAETRDRLFEPFFTTKPSGKGTGLGLATVHGIVEQSGGAIHVYSEPGHGSTFKVYFPAADAAPAGEAAKPAPARSAAAGEKILLVEDDASVRRLAQRALEELGYEVLAAPSRAEAVAVAAGAEGLRLALSDVVLPDGSGVALARELSEEVPGLRWLFMSGYGDHALVHSGELPPDAAFIGKPFSLDALAAKVREVLDARR